MRPQSSRAVRRSMHVNLHAQTTVHTHLTNQGYFDRRKKPEYPQFEPHARIKMAQVLGSPLYICGVNVAVCDTILSYTKLISMTRIATRLTDSSFAL